MSPSQREKKPEFDFDEEPSALSNWLVGIIFFLPWVLGLGVIGMILIEIFD